MRLPRYTAETPPPREPGLARATDIGALTQTGDIEVWRGISRLGQSMEYVARLGGAAYLQRKALDDDIRWGEGTLKTEEGVNELEKAADSYDYKVDEPLPDSPDYLKSPLQLSVEKRDSLINDALSEYDKKTKEIEQSFPTREGRERYKIWAAKRRLVAEKSLIHLYGLKHDEYQRDRLDELWKAAARNGDIETANSYIDKMDENELITPAQATFRKNKVKEIANQSLLDDIHEAAKALPYEVAIQFLNDIKGIDKADRNDLIARRKRQNEIETATTNRKVRWDALRKVSKDPDSVTDEYLEGLVKPNSLTWDDAEEIRKIRDTENHPLKTSRYKLYSGILDVLYPDATAPKTVGEIDRDKVLEYDQKSDELRNFFETNPDITPDKAKKFFDELAGEAKGDFLERLWGLFVIGTGGRGILPEKKEADTVIMISPDGRRYNVPIEKKQLFIDNGYKES